MFNTLTIRFDARIIESNLINPKSGLLYNEPTYLAKVELIDEQEIEYLETVTEEWLDQDRYTDRQARFQYENIVMLSTIRKPQLQGSLVDSTRDEQLENTTARFVCKLVTYDNGEVKLAPYIVEDTTHLSEYEPAEKDITFSGSDPSTW